MDNTLVIKNAVSAEVLTQAKDFCLDFLNIPNELPADKNLWYRKGSVHKSDFIKQVLAPIADQYINNPNAVLAGDTAFLIRHPPHDIHIDCLADDNHMSYKSVIFPIFYDGNTTPKFFTAEQFYNSPKTVRFRKGSEEWDSKNPNVSRQMKEGIIFKYDYSDVINIKDSFVLTPEWYKFNIDSNDFVPYDNFFGVSIEKEISWDPGSIIIFNSNRLHFSQNLQTINSDHKIGITLNYILPK